MVNKVALFNYFNPLSLYRERLMPPKNTNIIADFNPLSLYRERQDRRPLFVAVEKISIHSPYTGRDEGETVKKAVPITFQSTLPIQGETRRGRLLVHPRDISIHSPYTGRDNCAESQFVHIIFQSTLPIQGETRSR